MVAAGSGVGETAREGWFARLRAGLNRSSSQLKTNISAILTRRRLDADLEQLEEALITADLGVEAAAELRSPISAGHASARRSRIRR